MPTQLVTALFVEGRTDERFLPVLVQRTAEDILINRGRVETDVLEPIIVRPQHPWQDHAERMLVLAQENTGYHALIIHNDADYPTIHRALAERFQPGLNRIENAIAQGLNACRIVLPLIPIQMVEAWMMADPLALHQLIGSRLRVEDLELPLHPHQVESIPNPKERLRAAVSIAISDRPRRRRNIDYELSVIQEPLARQIRLVELRRVPAFQEFERYLSLALLQIGLLHVE
jgi:hypothetical protein